MFTKKRYLLALLCLFIHAFQMVAQNVPTPNEFLPYRLGEQFTPHHLLVDYYRAVAKAAPNKMILKEYGKTNELRPLLYAIISSPENLKNIEQIRLNNLRRTGLIEGKADNTNPIAILWISMNVHGNEPASSETSMALLSELLNSENKEVSEWLKKTVVIIDPCVNPDGYHRYTHWYNNVADAQPNINAEAREHNEPWPYGRVNHYLFDLNRDWAWATQVETQQRLEVYKEWMPQVHPDFHEMGFQQSYYFNPAAEPIHRYVTPFQRDFQTEIGKNHAKYFDANGWLYFTKEVFDLFYPSYGDTYPTFNGAVGMTYEQGGIRAGRAVLMENGDTLTLKNRIAHHLATALSTVEISAKNAARLCNNFSDYFQKNIQNPQGQYKTFVIKASSGKDKIKAFCVALDRHKIRYGLAGKASSASGYDYRTMKTATTNIVAEDVIVSAYQPLGLLAQVLLEPEGELSDSLTYDITAWSLIHAYGLEATALKQRLEPSQPLIFERVVALEKPAQPPYAYLARWNSLNNVQFLSNITQRGVHVRTAREPFDAEGQHFERGTLLITRGDNSDLGENFDKIVTAAALLNQQSLVLVKTGFSEKGADFGSDKMDILQRPRVAIIYDDEVDNNSFGQLWYYFEQDLKMPVTSLHTKSLNNAILGSYNIICLTEGRYGAMDSPRLERLREWIGNGGRLILIGEAVAAFEDKKGFELSKFPSKDESERAETLQTKQTLQRRYAHFCDAERTSLSDNLPGAIVKVTLDNSHPLAYGMGETYFSLKTNSLAYQPLKEAWNVGYLRGEIEKLGFIGYNAAQSLRGSLVFSVQPIRRGSVVYMVDNPLFRNFWYQGKFLFSNAVFMPIK